jgi:membrane protein DedA with SNARE-associated domain/rhodanese-related sulfurtransferase
MQQITHLIQHYGLIVVFVSVLVDKGGLPIPSYPVLAIAGALSLFGGAGIPQIIIAATAGALVADSLWYMVAAKLGRRVLSLLCRFSLSPDSCVRQTESMFTRIGPWTLLFAKFVPGLGYISVALSGITRMNLPLFLALDGIGAMFYVTVPVMLGRVFHRAVTAVLAMLFHLGEYGIAILIAAFGLYITIRWVERQVFIRRLRMDRISVIELVELIDRGRRPAIFDVRAADERRCGGIIPGAVAAHASDILATLKEYPRDAEIVIYCSCPNDEAAALAVLHLKRAGFKKIRPLSGGIGAWVNAGHTTETIGVETTIVQHACGPV